MPKTKPFDENYQKYEDWFDRNKYVYQTELELIKHVIPENGNGIEIGIGSGLFAKPLGIEIGIEPSIEMSKLAKKRELKVYRGVGENVPFKDNSFDFALMVTTVCFLDDAEKSLLEVERILKSKGSFIIGFVDKESPLGNIYLKFKYENIFYRIATFYSTIEVISLLKKTGFIIDKVYQTVFGNLDDIKNVQNYKDGFGEGGFVVIYCKTIRLFL
ncbi:MAG: class I SAM-dependent methyltransferase [Candidatus Cloacimonetes bacterium]|nr:class I SAM-dependent methyltransferase [Candidatus Cloacimonadota bacterium]